MVSWLYVSGLQLCVLGEDSLSIQGISGAFDVCFLFKGFLLDTQPDGYGECIISPFVHDKYFISLCLDGDWRGQCVRKRVDKSQMRRMMWIHSTSHISSTTTQMQNVLPMKLDW